MGSRSQMRCGPILIESLGSIAEGMDANEALGLTLARGEKSSNEKHRLTFGKVVSLDTWCSAKSTRSVMGFLLPQLSKQLLHCRRVALGRFPRPSEVLRLQGDLPVFRMISYEAPLETAWYNPDYSDLKKLEINESDSRFFVRYKALGVLHFFVEPDRRSGGT